MIVQSRLLIIELSSLIIFFISSNKTTEEMFLYFFIGGKYVPISPLLFAPSKASIIECITTSPSEWPIA